MCTVRACGVCSGVGLWCVPWGVAVVWAGGACSGMGLWCVQWYGPVVCSVRIECVVEFGECERECGECVGECG